MKSLFSISLCLFLCVACKKGKADFTLKGSVSDNTFSTALTGATIKIYEIEAGGGETNLLASSTINSDGNYSFTFPRNKAESYRVEIRKNAYFEQDIEIPFSNLTIEEDNVRNFSSTAKSWVKLRFTSTGANNLKYVKQEGKVDCSECCGNGEFFFTVRLTPPSFVQMMAIQHTPIIIGYLVL
ncbi:MAG: carboxypeptidase regulatory-like domain-containing protein [Crocinitomicaceae bacterium]|nr:carboxypeptidase regulatory-like domain-containing protein [Crocinitomicaceae bacterium]